jgi:hypothetical protein
MKSLFHGRRKSGAIAIAVTGAIALAASLAFLAAIPWIAGDEVGSGYSGVETSLCALDPAGTVPILIAGDSRAKFQISPALIRERTGLAAANVAEAYPLGGDAATLVNSLKRNRLPLACRPILLLSFSYHCANDLELDDIPLASLFNWRLRDHVRLAAHRPGRYFAFLAGRYLPALRRTLFHRWKGDGFACKEGETPYYPRAALDSSGFMPTPDTIPKLSREEGSEGDFSPGGANWRVLRLSLRWLARSGARRIVLLNAPVDPRWADEHPRSSVPAAEKAFSDSLSALAISLGREEAIPIHYFDFYRYPPSGLAPAHFFDRNHLNPRGARIYTLAIADSLDRILGNRVIGAIPSARTW